MATRRPGKIRSDQNRMPPAVNRARTFFDPMVWLRLWRVTVNKLFLG
jgi:hypothetical protein